MTEKMVYRSLIDGGWLVFESFKCYREIMILPMYIKFEIYSG